ncbi:MAG: Do family serine endopeptidase [Legionellaceae bacterium]|nr:Do family serine endopeptidase [Legionellaceae bacterium]
MKRLSSVTFFLILWSLLPSAFAETVLPTLAPVLKKAMPAIVNISVQGMLPGAAEADEEEAAQSSAHATPPKPRKFQSIGSGVIIDPKNGVIVTNDHVVRNAAVITITINDGRRLPAKLLGSDSETDIAVLKINAPNLKTLPLGNSDNSQVGDFVMAIGNPFGLNSFGNSQSATFGIISALKRSDLNIEGIENFIQTDAAINPGNSGGALINTEGELIGINTAIISPFGGGNVGVGFAIPINMVRDIVQQLLRFGSIQRGLMGIFVQHLTPELAQAWGYSPELQGALIAQVNGNSPAEKAGLKPGDIIIKINDTPINEATQVKTSISLLRAGSDVKITVQRDKKEMVFHAIVTDFKKQEQQEQQSNPFLYGLSFKNFEENSALHGHIQGVQIVGASESSSGWREGLRPGDVIIGANKQAIQNIKMLQAIAQGSHSKLLLQVLRGPGALYILLN